MAHTAGVAPEDSTSFAAVPSKHNRKDTARISTPTTANSKTAAVGQRTTALELPISTHYPNARHRQTKQQSPTPNNQHNTDTHQCASARSRTSNARPSPLPFEQKQKATDRA